MRQPLRKANPTSSLIAMALAGLLSGPSMAMPAMTMSASPDLLGTRYSILGQWQDYALQSITPAFARAMPELSGLYPAQAPGMLPASALLADLELMMPMDSGNDTVVFALQDRRASILAASVNDTSSLRLIQPAGWAMDRQLLTSGVRHSVGNDGWWQVSAVLATQRFRLFENGSAYSTQQLDRQALGSLDTPSYGAGLRFGLESRLLPRFSLGLSYQTRIDMDALTAYRGLFNKPADFDIPAHASVLLKVHASDRQTLTFEAQRIQYSQIDPFNSYLLPDRFTSLLGDGGSPEFSWNDLTVYNVHWNWQPEEAWQVQATWGTGNQPSPSSSLLYQALVPDYARQNLNLAVAYRSEQRGTLSLAMRYAQPEPLYENLLLSRNRLKDRLAVEMNWSLEF